MSCLTSAMPSTTSPTNNNTAALSRKQSMLLPETVRENISPKTIRLLGDKTLMPRAARKRLGSSLSGDQLHEYIVAMEQERSL